MYMRLIKILEDINVRPEDKEMISGIIDMLRQVKDLNNRKQMAFDRLRDFKKEKIKVDSDEFLKQCGLGEGICVRKAGESDEDFLTRCGNPNRIPNGYNDRETSGVKLQKLMVKKKLPKDMKWNQGFTLETNEDMPGGAFVGLVSPQGYINGSPSKKKKKEEDIVNDNEIDRKDMLLNKFLKSIIKAKEKANVLESHIYNCPKCGHKWKGEEGGQDETICHKCGHNLYHVKEVDINKPSPKLRPEPHPTRHETEHPPYEKDAMKPKGKYSAPTKK